MSNPPEQSQPYNDEIDLAELVRGLWQGKWLVIGVTLATLALGITYLSLAPKNYTASLNISALPAAQSDVYVELNATKLMPIDEQVLLTLFVEDLQTQNSAAYNFSLVASKSANWVLNFPTQKPGALAQIVADTLELSNQNVKKLVGQRFARALHAHSNTNQLAIEALDLEFQQKISQFEADKNRQIIQLGEQAITARSAYSFSSRKEIALLSEQAQIARSLNMDKGSYVSLATAQEPVLYLRGYLALEKEISLIKSRKAEVFIQELVDIKTQTTLINSRKAEDFIPDLTRIELLKSELLSNKKVEKAEVLLANTPIGTDQFAAVSYNLDSIAYKNNTKTSLILALSIVLGGMLGIFVLLIRNVLINKD
jgi:chain length determinant protein (polysaccharide antigen chain regulator)